MHIKIQSWFPFMVQIYINGHEWLKQQLIDENIPFKMYNNSFSYIENISKAQEIADKLVDSKISDKFDAMIKEINNFLPTIEKTFSHGYYWCLAECEYSTDIIHDSRESIDEYFKTLVENAFYTFKCNDVMSFFGRKLQNTGFQFSPYCRFVKIARKRFQPVAFVWDRQNFVALFFKRADGFPHSLPRHSQLLRKSLSGNISVCLRQ